MPFVKEGGQMEAEVREFRKRARRENGGRGGTSLRYSRELRLEAVAYLARKKREGVGLAEVASELGVSNWSLSRWVQESERRVSVVPVEVTEAAESTGLFLVTPRGYRVEGLSEESLLRLVERLG
jgi:transposase-like protein